VANNAESETQSTNKHNHLFYLIGIVGCGLQLDPIGTAATNGLLCQPRVIMMMEKLVE
jgi:hypothetical protein